MLKCLHSFFSIQFVSFANIYSLTDQTMRAIASFSKNLVALDIRGCWRITDKGMSLVAEYCPKLKVLSVADCRDITEKSLGRLRSRGVRIDRASDPLYLQQNQKNANPPELRLQV